MSEIDGSTPDTPRSLTRLVIGGLAWGWETLADRLPPWAQEAARAPTAPPLADEEGGPPSPPDTTADLARYALTGLLFASQAAFRRRAARLGQAADKQD